jgi:hypothetical protein
MKAVSVLLLSLLGSSGPQDAKIPAHPLEGHAIRQLYVGLPPGTRVEYFRLDRESLLEEHDRIPGPTGLVRWIVGPDPEHEDSWRVEFEAIFFDSDTQVVHTERLRPQVRELVFREIRHQAGRTLYLTWDPEAGIRSVEMMAGELRRKDIDPGKGALFPLSAIEMVRQGVDFQGETPVFQPLVGATESLELSVTDDGPERVLELSRADGLLAGSYRFRDAELVSFRWQDGGPVATRVSRRFYEGLLATQNEQLATEAALRESRD